ncbi:PE-PGRS family protein [Mycobacterium tuberculosis]|nr:PE-PGRS family protein [Mycobacterium tuberculosis]
MSFVIAQPEMIAAAAGELASIRSAINAANAAAAAQTTGVMSAAAFHAQVVRTLTVDAGAYASAEAANAGPNMLAAVNAPAPPTRCLRRLPRCFPRMPRPIRPPARKRPPFTPRWCGP